MLVKLETTKYLISAELEKTERVTHLAAKNRIRPRTCYSILYEIEQRGDFHVTWGFTDDGYFDTVQILRKNPNLQITLFYVRLNSVAIFKSPEVSPRTR